MLFDILEFVRTLNPIVVLIIAAAALVFLILLFVRMAQVKRHKAEFAALDTRYRETAHRLEKAEEQVHSLEERCGTLQRFHDEYVVIPDARAEAERIQSEAQARAYELRSEAEVSAQKLQEDAADEYADMMRRAKEDAAATRKRAQATAEKADQLLAVTIERARRMIEDARREARRIGKDGYTAIERLEETRAQLQAVEHAIQGYGDQYLVPSYTVLDELAITYSFTEAGQKLRSAREYTRSLVNGNQAAVSSAPQADVAAAAVRFIVDAFNGKVDSLLTDVKHDNYGTLREALNDAFRTVNMNGREIFNTRITQEYLDARLEELQWACAVQEIKRRAQEEQREARERMREEEKARKEYEAAIKKAEQEEKLYQELLRKAQEEAARASETERAKFDEQIADLQAKLKEAEEANQRALSMAQQTKHGYVYVISNIGSFGENVYKIGMTRRLQPRDRVNELGDASVPFPFDVHAIIRSDDAPALETDLHRHFAATQVNKVNARKEFFNVPIAEIRAYVESRGIPADWTIEADAAQYRESLHIAEQNAADPFAQASWMAAQEEQTAIQDEWRDAQE